MADDLFKGMTSSIPYEIAMVRPLRQTTLRERLEALESAYYNTELIPQELVYVDLKTDSGVSSLSVPQLAAMMGQGALESGIEMAAEGSAALTSLSNRFREIFGFPYMLPCTQGRAAERIWVKMHVKKDSVVPGNMLFPSTRFHIESNGARVIDVICHEAHNLSSEAPFKGNMDIEKLENVLQQKGREKVACIYVELCVNSCGGHPVSIGNLKQVKSLAESHRVPLFLDACRILENSYLVQQREQGYRGCSIPGIVKETCSLADGCTMSALKDFLVPMGGFIGIRDRENYQKAFALCFLDGAQLPGACLESTSTALNEIFASPHYVSSRVEQVNYLWHKLKGSLPILSPPGGHAVFIDVKSFLPRLSSEHHPAEALAAFVYYVSGIRLVRGPPLAQSQVARGTELLRLAIPARRYLQGHMDDVAEAVHYAYSKRDEIRGLKSMQKAGRSKYDPSLFTPVES